MNATKDASALRLVIRFHRATAKRFTYSGSVTEAAHHTAAARALTAELVMLTGNDDCHTPAAWRHD